MRAQGAAFAVHDRALIDFLQTKRWFGKKSHGVREAEVTDVIPIHWPGSARQFAVARARVTTDQGSACYQLFLEQSGGADVTDALEDAQFRRGLADAFVEGATFDNGGGHTRWIVQRETRQPLVVPSRAKITLSKAEQSNSSIIIDGEAILKLYRRLEHGTHPDVEVTRFLTIERLFVNVPVLLGTIRFEDDQGVMTAGMLQELVPGAVDGWSYALDRASEYIGARDGHPRELPFEEEAQQLGEVTRALHETLASGDSGSEFDLRPATRDDVRRWARGATQTIEHALTALTRALEGKRVAQDMRSDAERVTENGERYERWIEEIVSDIGVDAGANTRTHGDYHLGQVLRSETDQFLVIDFEGEPSRPMTERRARNSPLRDVAGMLRSFAYAAATAGGGRGQAGSGRREAGGGTADRWEHHMRDAFLRGYFSEMQGRVGLLPQSQTHASRLISLFEMEKLFYELQYELDHRPDWVWIPLGGIMHLDADSASRLPPPASRP